MMNHVRKGCFEVEKSPLWFGQDETNPDRFREGWINDI